MPDLKAPPFRIGVFASGGGSNLQAILDKIKTGELPIEVAFVLSNNSKCGALTRARDFGIPVYHVSSFTEGSEDKAALRINDIVRTHAPDLLVLAGYMKKVPSILLTQLKNRILNIHPALLPAFGGEGFYGSRVHEAVIARGAQFTGITIHMVNAAYDEGQIILQKIVPVPIGTTAEQLAAKVLECEHAHFWRVILGFALGDIRPTNSDYPSKAVDLHAFQQSMSPGHGA